jgi:hypothetical protein
MQWEAAPLPASDSQWGEHPGVSRIRWRKGTPHRGGHGRTTDDPAQGEGRAVGRMGRTTRPNYLHYKGRSPKAPALSPFYSSTWTT